MLNYMQGNGGMGQPQAPQPLDATHMKPMQPQAPANALMPQRPTFDRAAFQALPDHLARVGFTSDWTNSMQQYHDAMHAYNQQNRQGFGPMHGGGPGMPGGPVMTPGGGGTGSPPQANNLFPLNPGAQQGYQQQMMPNPQGMVGSSLYVNGMTPASSPFGMPGY